MSIPTTSSFTETCDQIILNALILLGIYGPTDTLSTTDELLGFNFFNLMLKHWEAMGIHIWTTSRATLFLNPGQFEYSLGNNAGDSNWANTYSSPTITAVSSLPTGATPYEGSYSSAASTATGTFTFPSIYGPPVSTGVGHYTSGLLDTVVSGSPPFQLHKYTGANVLTLTLSAAIPTTTTNVLVMNPTTNVITSVPILSLDTSVNTVCYVATTLSSLLLKGTTVVSIPTIPIKPLQIMSCSRRSFSSGFLTGETTDIIMPSISFYDYQQLTNKNTPGYPLQWKYEPVTGSGIFTIWPVPMDQSNVLHFEYIRPLFDLTTGADNPDVPQEWLLAITYNLAALLAPAYGKSAMLQTMMPLAQSLLQDVDGYDREKTSMYLEPSKYRY